MRQGEVGTNSHGPVVWKEAHGLLMLHLFLYFWVVLFVDSKN
jgi:hypothetical protein